MFYNHQQEPNVETLCSSVRKVAETTCLEMLPDAETIDTKFKRAFILFGKCHNLYNGGVLTKEEIDQLGM